MKFSETDPTFDSPDGRLGDFTATSRIVPISLLALAIGTLGGLLAMVLLRLIGLFTNLFFFHRWSTAMVSPADHTLGAWAILVPVAGALIIGLMARYGSERIRGHGIPEALEAILIRGSRVEPRLAILKPLSAAISIGSGGPFGAEGPIIMTGGAFGSLIAQGFHLTSAERKTLLVAGAAAGMTATFASPLASLCLAVELLLFELKPRSFVPVALACAAAMAARHFVLPPGPLFPLALALPSDFIGAAGLVGLAGCALAGLGAGILSALMTGSVYLFEDLFQEHLRRIHWMWWPALAGLVIGLGGLVCPAALGVGYEALARLLSGQMALSAVLVLIAVKWAIWSFALGSGTSGGVLAPLLMLGAALGNIEAQFLPPVAVGFWPLIGMGAILGGTMRAPLTGILFAVEITHAWDAILPLAVAVTVAHAFSVLVMRRSILTEKVSRRGFHVTREYAVDPLEILFVRDVMRAPAAESLPVVEGASIAYAEETLRSATHRMAHTGITEMRVEIRATPGVAVGVVALADVLQARRRHLEEETRRERVLLAAFGLGSAPSGDIS